jgi:2-iminobutanoate/2-iminopropanoate deaminase
MVTMTVFLIDARYTTRMTEIRSEIFKNDFAAAGFADPNMMIEIQGVAVPG